MGTKRNFIVVAYDIADDKRRRMVVKELQKLGTRINYSVFECFLTDKQFDSLYTKLDTIINPKEDLVAYYPICLDCYAKIVYQPQVRRAYKKVISIG